MNRYDRRHFRHVAHAALSLLLAAFAAQLVRRRIAARRLAEPEQ